MVKQDLQSFWGTYDGDQQHWTRNQKQQRHFWILHLEMGGGSVKEGHFQAVCVVSLIPTSSYSEKQLIVMLAVQPFFLARNRVIRYTPSQPEKEVEPRRIHPWSYSELSISEDGFLALNHFTPMIKFRQKSIQLIVLPHTTICQLFDSRWPRPYRTWLKSNSLFLAIVAIRTNC